MSNSDQSTSSNRAPNSRRRRILNWLAGLSIVSFFLALLTPLKDLALAVEAVEGREDVNLPGQRLVFAHEHESEPGGHTHQEGTVVTTNKLQAPAGVSVFPEDLSQEGKYLIMLHKLNPEDIQPPTNSEWTDQGFVAYSAICTHLGCTVSWNEEEHEVGGPHDHCPCHVGEFDPYRGAEVVTGPPPRPLPQIGIEVNENDELVISTEFEGEIGGE